MPAALTEDFRRDLQREIETGPFRPPPARSVRSARRPKEFAIPRPDGAHPLVGRCSARSSGGSAVARAGARQGWTAGSRRRRPSRATGRAPSASPASGRETVRPWSGVHDSRLRDVRHPRDPLGPASRGFQAAEGSLVLLRAGAGGRGGRPPPPRRRGPSGDERYSVAFPHGHPPPERAEKTTLRRDSPKLEPDFRTTPGTATRRPVEAAGQVGGGRSPGTPPGRRAPTDRPGGPSVPRGHRSRPPRRRPAGREPGRQDAVGKHRVDREPRPPPPRTASWPIRRGRRGSRWRASGWHGRLHGDRAITITRRGPGVPSRQVHAAALIRTADWNVSSNVGRERGVRRVVEPSRRASGVVTRISPPPRASRPPGRTRKAPSDVRRPRPTRGLGVGRRRDLVRVALMAPRPASRIATRAPSAAAPRRRPGPGRARPPPPAQSPAESEVHSGTVDIIEARCSARR